MDAQGRPQLIGVPKAAAKPVAQGKPKKTSVKNKKNRRAGGKKKAKSAPRAEVVSDSDTPIIKRVRKPRAKATPVLVFTPKPHETREASYLTNFPQKFLHIHDAIPAYFYGPLWHQLVVEQKKRNSSEAEGDYSLFEEYLVWAAGYALEIAKTDCKPVRAAWAFPGPEPEPWSD
jgi:hypothetical protein